jgi:hypothetical protein
MSKSLQKSRSESILLLITWTINLGEIIPSASSPLSLTAVVSISCSLAAVIVALIQSGQSCDDDDPGPGDGGLMQPVGAGA